MNENNQLNENDIMRGIVPAGQKPIPAITFESLEFTGTDPDYVMYLLLLKDLDDDDTDPLQTWEVHMGRQDTYDHLKDFIMADFIDVSESFIYSTESTNRNIADVITVYRFMKLMKDNDLVIDNSGFDIDSYRCILDEDEPDKKIFESIMIEEDD